MAMNLPESFDESAFIDDIGQHPELFDISHSMYSNNENCRSVFRQIGTGHGINGVY